jgi:hypothetical protein
MSTKNGLKTLLPDGLVIPSDDRSLIIQNPETIEKVVDGIFPFSGTGKPHVSVKTTKKCLLECLRVTRCGKVVATAKPNTQYEVKSCQVYNEAFDQKMLMTVYPVCIQGGINKSLNEIPLYHNENEFRWLAGSKPSTNVANALEYVDVALRWAYRDGYDMQGITWKPRGSVKACLFFVQSSLQDLPSSGAAIHVATEGNGEQPKKKRKAEPTKKRVYKVVAVMYLGSHLVLTVDRPFNLRSTFCESYRLNKTIKLEEIVCELLIGTGHSYAVYTSQMNNAVNSLANVPLAILEDDLRETLRAVKNARYQPLDNMVIGNSAVRDYQMRTTGKIVFEACWPILLSEDVSISSAEPYAKKKEVQTWFHTHVIDKWMNHGHDFALEF